MVMTERDIEILAARASALRQAGRVEEAIAAYRALLAARPGLAASWYNLGWLQRQARRFEEALAAYAQALACGIDDPEEVHLNRAVILSDHLGRPDDAAAELARALALSPDYVPALLNLGNLHEDRGDRDAARGSYARVLALEPGNVLALARSAGLTGADEAGPVVRELASALERSDLTPYDQADLGFALGRLRDAMGDYDAAFAAYGAANQASRSAARAAGFAGYDARQHERLVDRLIETFDRPVAARAADEGPAPLFICGMFRSGSSLTEQILACHEGVVAGGERDLIPAIVARFLQPYPERCAGLDADAYDQLRRAYLAGSGPAASDDRLATDKRPDNFLHVGLIKSIFPNAKIVHTQRQPLDNVLSLYFLHLDARMPYATDLDDAAHWYREYRRLMAHWSRLYADDIFHLDYDALVAEPRPTIAALLDFCGLEWRDACLEPHRARTVVKTSSVWQVREPLYRRSSGRWQHYAPHLAAIREALEPK